MPFIKTDNRHTIEVEKMISNQIKQYDIGIRMQNTTKREYE